MSKSLFGGIAAIGALIGAIVFASSWTQIDTGNVGVSRWAGKTSMQELPPGWHLTGFATVDEFTTKEIGLPFNDMKPKSKDNLTIADLDVDVYIKANPGNVAETVVKYQGDVVRHKDVVPDKGTSDLIAGYGRFTREIREAVYSATAEYEATTLHTKRTDLAASIQKRVQSELDKGDKGTWLVTGVNVRNLVTDPAIERSIRENAERDIQIAAAQKLKDLEAAKAQAKIEEAKGTARANELVASSLTPLLVRMKEIEAQQAFAKQGTHTVLLPAGGSANALINTGK